MVTMENIETQVRDHVIYHVRLYRIKASPMEYVKCLGQLAYSRWLLVMYVKYQHQPIRSSDAVETFA